MAHYLFIDTAGSRGAGKRGKHFIYLQLYFTKVIVRCRYLLCSPLLHVFISTTVLGAEKMVAMIDFTKNFMICIFAPSTKNTTCSM